MQTSVSNLFAEISSISAAGVRATMPWACSVLVFKHTPHTVPRLASSALPAGSRLYFDFLHKNQFDRWQSFDGVHVVAKVN